MGELVVVFGQEFGIGGINCRKDGKEHLYQAMLLLDSCGEENGSIIH